MTKLPLLLATMAICAAARAAEPMPEPMSWPAPPASLKMQAVESLDQDPISPKLGNGSVANPAMWPASFIGTYQIGGQYFNCTSTLIAPQVLLTAAHCIANNGNVTIVLKTKSYSGTCQRPQNGYPGVLSLDIALCKMDVDVPAYRYERISLAAGFYKHDMQLVLAGYGCQKVGSPSDKQFRTGPAFVQYLPGEFPGRPHWFATFAGVARNDAFICPGDSGGAVYYEQATADRRLIIAVNSHYDTAERGVSFLTALSAPGVAEFVTNWADNTKSADGKGQRLCGVHADAQNCR
jgi:hypothetical protein